MTILKKPDSQKREMLCSLTRQTNVRPSQGERSLISSLTSLKSKECVLINEYHISLSDKPSSDSSHILEIFDAGICRGSGEHLVDLDA